MYSSWLVVDDDRALRDCLGEFLSVQGHEVHLAATGGEALELARRTRFHASLLDVEMPGLDGIETARRLRCLQRGLPVVFMTASGSRDLRDRAEALPCFAWLAKPVAVQVLLATVRRLLVTHYPELAVGRPEPRPGGPGPLA